MSKNSKPKWLDTQELLKKAGTSLQKKAEVEKTQPKLKVNFKQVIAYRCPSCGSKFSTGQLESKIKQAARTGQSFIECTCGSPLKEERIAEVRDLSPIINRAQYIKTANRLPGEGRVPNMWVDKAIYGRLVQKLGEYIAKVGITNPQLRFQKGIRSSKFPGQGHSAKGAEFSIEFIDHNNTRNRIFIQAGLTAKGEFIFPKTFKNTIGQEFPLTAEAIKKLTSGKLFDPVIPDMQIPPLNYRYSDPTRFREISADQKKMKKTAQGYVDVNAAPNDPAAGGDTIDEQELDMHVQEMGITDPADQEAVKQIMRKYVNPNNPEAFAPGMSAAQPGQNFTQGLGLGIAKLNLRKIDKIAEVMKQSYEQAVLDALNDGLTYDEAVVEVYNKTGMPLNEKIWSHAAEYLEQQAEQSPIALESALADQLVSLAEEKVAKKFRKTAEDVKNEFDFSGLTSKEVETFVDTFLNTYNEALDNGEGPINAQRKAHIKAGVQLHENRIKLALRDEDTLVPFVDTDPDYSLAEQTKQSEPRFDHEDGPPKKYHEMDGGISEREDRNVSNMFGRKDSQHFSNTKSMIKKATITQEDGQWVVKSESGKILGKHKTKEEAQDQLAAVEISKHKKSSVQKKTAAYEVTQTGQNAIEKLRQGLPVGDFDPQALLGILTYLQNVPYATTETLARLGDMVGMNPIELRNTFSRALEQGLLTIAPEENVEGFYEQYTEGVPAETAVTETIASKNKIQKEGESTGIDLEPNEVGQNPINYSRYVNMIQDEIRAGNIPPTKVDLHALKDGQYTLDELKDLIQTFKVDSDAVMYPTSHASREDSITKIAEQKLSDLVKEMPLEKQPNEEYNNESAEKKDNGEGPPPLSKEDIEKMHEEMGEDTPEPDTIEGGFGDDVPSAAFDAEQLIRGIKVEFEHTGDIEKAEEIAKDHLMEDPAYYIKLYEMENISPPRDVEDLYNALVNTAQKQQQYKYAIKPEELSGEPVSIEEGQKIAQQLGVIFNGIQPQVEGPSVYIFTDPVTGSSFVGDNLETTKESLVQTRARFAHAGRLSSKKAQEEDLPPGTILGPGGEIISGPQNQPEAPGIRLEPPKYLTRKAPGVEEAGAVEATPEEATLVKELADWKNKADTIQAKIADMQRELNTRIAPLQAQLGAAGQGQMWATKALTTLMKQLNHSLIQADNLVGQYVEMPQKLKLTTTEKVKILLDKFGEDAVNALIEAEKNLNQIEQVVVGKYKQWPKKQSADIEAEDQYVAALYQETYNTLANLLDTVNELNFALAA